MLELNPVLLLTTVAVFLLLLFILNNILYRPLMEFMKNRDNSIAIDYENAGKNRSDVDSYHEEAQQLIREAKAEAGLVRSKAIEAAKESAAKKIEEQKAELEEEYSAFLKGLDAEHTEFKNGLLAQMPLYKEGIKAKLNQI